MDRSVRKVTFEDLERVLQIYAGARHFMEIHGNPHQWGKDKPQRTTLEEDIRRGDLYAIVRDDKIVGVFAFMLGEDPTYAQIFEGGWRRNDPYGTIHRIAGDGSGGILHTCICYCERIIPYLRIDTHEDNVVMQRAVAKEGFTRCGIIYIADGTPRIAYDRYA